MGCSLAVVIPFCFWGNPSGHDFEFHMFSWMEVAQQWKAGIFYPRWAALSHWAYGEARFLFYPPLSWNLGALLGSFVPWVAAPAVYICLALSAAGCSMFLLARRWMPRPNAIFAAAFYVVNPYHLVIVYWRSALAELLASCLMPLLLLFVLRLSDDDRPRSILPLATVIAAAWLTNGPSAVMVNYSVALLALVAAIVQHQGRIFGKALIAVAIGGFVSAFYLIPAAYEQRWVNIAEVLAPGVRPADNFLFTLMNDPDHNRFNRLVSFVAVAELVVVGLAIAASSLRQNASRTIRWATGAWAGAIAVLLVKWSLPLWEHLPKLQYVQLPWRWLLCLNVVCALLLPLAVPRWWMRFAMAAGLLMVVVLCWRNIQPPWWDTAADIQEMHDAVADGTGYEGTDEYVPAGADPYDLDKGAPQARVEGDVTQNVQVLDWRSQRREIAVTVPEPSMLRLRLFNYPAWQVSMDGAPVSSTSAEHTGELLISVPAGSHRVTVIFARTWDRAAGAAVSAFTIVLIGLWIGWDRARARPDRMARAA
jgi:hypothetical protein